MTRTVLAFTFYAACTVFLYAAFQLPAGWEECSTGWPSTDEGILVALLTINAMAAKLMGHVMLLSTARAR